MKNETISSTCMLSVSIFLLPALPEGAPPHGWNTRSRQVSRETGAPDYGNMSRPVTHTSFRCWLLLRDDRREKFGALGENLRPLRSEAFVSDWFDDWTGWEYYFKLLRWNETPSQGWENDSMFSRHVSMIGWKWKWNLYHKCALPSITIVRILKKHEVVSKPSAFQLVFDPPEM